MFDAATAYRLSRLPFENTADEACQMEFDDRVLDDHSRAYWAAAARVLSDIIERDGVIHPAQLFYVSSIYPERVTVEEALEVFVNPNISQVVRGKWEAAAAYAALRPDISPPTYPATTLCP